MNSSCVCVCVCVYVCVCVCVFVWQESGGGFLPLGSDFIFTVIRKSHKYSVAIGNNKANTVNVSSELKIYYKVYMVGPSVRPGVSMLRGVSALVFVG